MFELDRTITHRIGVKGHEGYLFYNNRATWATSLSILSQGVEILVGEDLMSQRKQARTYCNQMVRNLLAERRNAAGLWPGQYVQFHWVQGAVESLLRYSRYVTRRSLRTSEEEIYQAADMLLKDENFINMFRETLLQKIHEVGKASGEFEEDSSSTENEGEDL